MSLPRPLRIDRPLIALSLAVLAVFLFATSDAVTKYLTMQYPVPLVSAVRYDVSLMAILLVFGPRVRSGMWTAQRPVLLFLRGVALCGVALMMGLALRVMPVGETVAIMFLAPILVMALSAPLLKEHVSGLGWILAGLAFAGVILIVRPGAALDPHGMSYALVMACLMAVFHLSTRALSRTETSMAMLFYVTLSGAMIFSFAAIPSAPLLVQIGGFDFAMMVFLGVLTTAGHYLFSVAYTMAPASMVAPVTYLHVVWAAVLGWGVFGHIPDGWTLLGMAMILFAGASIGLSAHWGRAR